MPSPNELHIFRYTRDGDVFVFEEALTDGEFVRFYSANEGGWRKFMRSKVRPKLERISRDAAPAGLIDAYREFVARVGRPPRVVAKPPSKSSHERSPRRAPWTRTAKGHGVSGTSASKAAPLGPVSQEDLNRIQQHLAQSQQPLFVTGRAGTGKSSVLRHVAAAHRGRCVVLAPTGIAALNAGGTTVHRFFGFPLRPLTRTDVRRGKWLDVIRKADVIILDEVSMLRADVADCVSSALGLAADAKDVPFGGKSVLFFGDAFQLPAFFSRDEETAFRALGYTSPHFFHASSLQTAAPRTLELTQVYRQSDPAFVAALDRLRLGQTTTADIQFLNSRVRSQDTGELDTTVILTARRDRADHVNAARLESLDGAPFQFSAECEGSFDSIGDDDRRVPAPRELVLKRGARVMCVKNDKDERWVNGSLGEVEDIVDDVIQVQLDSGPSVLVTQEEWQQIDYNVHPETGSIGETVVGTYRQYPLQLAWATTIHKAQGLTLDRVHVDLDGGAFAAGQVYVALSRCRSVERLSLERPLRERDLRVDGQVLRFMSRNG